MVAEPTGLDVVVAHKGVIRWKCRMTGRTAHSSQPDRGDNAIYKMARVLAGLGRAKRKSFSSRRPTRCAEVRLSTSERFKVGRRSIWCRIGVVLKSRFAFRRASIPNPPRTLLNT